MIPNYENEGWHHLAVKKLSTLLRGITSKHPSDFFVWIVFRTENKLKTHQRVFKSKYFCGIVMLLENNMLEFSHYMKAGKMSYNICADMESLIE